MVPARRSFCPDVANDIAANAIPFGKFVKDATPPGGSSNCRYLSFRKLGVRVSGASLGMRSTVSDHVAHIFFSGGPPQIAGDVVGARAIRVSNIVTPFRGRAVERFADKTMQFGRLWLTINHKIYEVIAPPLTDGRGEDATVGQPAYASGAGHLIKRGACNLPPDFHPSLHNQRQDCSCLNMYCESSILRKAAQIAALAVLFQNALLVGGWA